MSDGRTGIRWGKFHIHEIPKIQFHASRQRHTTFAQFVTAAIKNASLACPLDYYPDRHVNFVSRPATDWGES